MTLHLHDSSSDASEARPDAAAPVQPGDARGRSRWLLPAVAAGVVATGLVVAGVLSLSTVLYAGFFGGMLLMHLGGHGHGGHGGHGRAGYQGTHGALDGDQDADRRDLSERSDDSQPRRSALGHELDDRAPKENRDGTGNHDRHTARSCH